MSGFLKKDVHFLFLSFWFWRKQKRKSENMEKEYFKKNKKNGVFWVVVTKQSFWHFLEIGKHYLCSEGKEKARILVAIICLGRMALLCDHTRSPNTTKIGVSAGTREKPKWHFWFQKSHFGKGPRKGALLSVIHKSYALLKTQFL